MGPAGECADDTRPLMREVLSVLSESPGELPLVTVSWAQSVGGAIAGPGGVPSALSGPEALCLTHRLRTLHGAILVGIQTVLNDDPLLSVRLAKGRQPQPVVLDSRLRLPLSARLLARVDRKPWIFAAAGAARGNAAALEERGARIFTVGSRGDALDLREVLSVLRAQGIGSVMVEGGARVLGSFLAQGLARQVVVTVSPQELAGVQGPGIPRCVRSIEETWGSDRVFWGVPE